MGSFTKLINRLSDSDKISLYKEILFSPTILNLNKSLSIGLTLSVGFFLYREFRRNYDCSFSLSPKIPEPFVKKY